MSVGFCVITVTSDQHMFDAETFLRRAQERWPQCRVMRHDPGRYISDAEFEVNSADGPLFLVIHFPGGGLVSIDGDLDQTAEVAVWLREVHPDPDLVLWFTDGDFSGHTVLFPGITAEEVSSGWVKHSEHDPFVEYPDYFK